MPSNPKEPTRWCDCCEAMVSASTERRHRQGLQAPLRLRVRALVAEKAQNLAKTRNRRIERGEASGSGSRKGVKSLNKAPGLKDHAHSDSLSLDDQPDDSLMMDGTFEPGPAPAAVEEIQEEAVSVGEEVAGVQQTTWSGRGRYRVTVEEVEDEDDDRFDRHDVDSESERDTDEVYDEDEDSDEEDEDGLTEEDHIDEEWERELAEFSMWSFKFSSLHANIHITSGKIFRR